MRYQAQREVIHLAVFGDAEESKGSRVKPVNVCASGKSEYAWMNADVCVSRKGGRLNLPKFDRPEVAAAFIVNLHTQEVLSAQEHVGVVAVDSQNRPVGAAIIHKGGDAMSLVDPKSVLRVVLMLPATGFIIWHNHPSESPQPSADDIDFSRRLVSAANVVALRFLDSLVITPDPAVFTSLVTQGSIRP